MVVGILESNNKESSVTKYLHEKFLYEYVDVDEILKDLLKNEFSILDFNDLKNKINSSLILKIRNILDEKLLNVLENTCQDDVILVKYSLLEELFVFEQFDILIDASSNFVDDNNIDGINLLIKNRYNSNVHKYNNINYHIVINPNENWQEKIDDYFNFNLNNSSKVSVVVPIYNTGEYLFRCVESIINQSYRNLEILLIDDGSTDDSLEMCKLLEKKDNRIKVIHQKNVGLAETRNNGMNLATGEYICFIDSDDYIECGMVETLLRKIQETKSDVCEGSFYIHQRDGSIKDVTVEQKGNKYIEGKKELINAYSDATILIPAWDKIYKLSSIKNIKFDKNCFKEDSDYIYKLCMAGKTFSLVAYPFYHYVKRNSTSITGNKISKELFTLKKWGENAYNEVIALGLDYKDAAEKILYNSLVHIIRYYLRDYKNNVLDKDEYRDEIQDIVNELIKLLLSADNVKKFRKVDEVLEIIHYLSKEGVIDNQEFPTLDVPCIGILWNSLDDNLKAEAVEIIKKKAIINDSLLVDFGDAYRDFIKEIYYYNNEFEGIPIMKAGSLIDRYESNEILILNMVIKVSNYVYFSKSKGFMFEEIASLKSYIRKYFKEKIRDYAYDNIFHLTVDMDEYLYTAKVCEKFNNRFNGGNLNENEKGKCKKLSRRFSHQDYV